MLNGFTLGKFVSYTHNGCQDGYLEFSEASRMAIGGMFCGQSWGPSVFYSETRSLVLTVKLFKLLREQSGYNFDFRIDFKFLSKDESVVRYGGIKSDTNETMTKETHQSSINIDNKITTANKKSKAFDNYHEEFTARANNWYESTLNMTSLQGGGSGKNQKKPKLNKNQKNATFIDQKYVLGDLIPGTYCSRIFSSCDKKLCRLQSPNFPGTYPRNLTCYFAVRQVSTEKTLLHCGFVKIIFDGEFILLMDFKMVEEFLPQFQLRVQK